MYLTAVPDVLSYVNHQFRKQNLKAFKPSTHFAHNDSIISI